MDNKNWLHDLFINEAKPALNRHSSSSGSGSGGSYVGKYSSTKTYVPNDIVLLEGDVYRCINENVGFNPSEYIGVYWELLHDGDNDSGDITMTDDGEGNVTLVDAYGNTMMTDDGDGNVTIGG